jgi:hypothetical protein
MVEHEAFRGVTCDHLYQNCPGLNRSLSLAGERFLVGVRLISTVDPLGTDICGWCVRKWMGRSDGRTQ